MSARIVITCDGVWEGDMRCRGALPTDTTIADLAREDARAAGWSMAADRQILDVEDLDEAGDLCPAHARLHAAAGASVRRGRALLP